MDIKFRIFFIIQIIHNRIIKISHYELNSKVESRFINLWLNVMAIKIFSYSTEKKNFLSHRTFFEIITACHVYMSVMTLIMEIHISLSHIHIHFRWAFYELTKWKLWHFYWYACAKNEVNWKLFTNDINEIELTLLRAGSMLKLF